MKTILVILLGLVIPVASHAGSATWNLDPATSDWNTATNWMPATIPNGPADVATFGVSNRTSVSISASTEVDSIVFTSNASAFTVSASEGGLTISGAGIINNSGLMQNLIAEDNGTPAILILNKNAVVGDQIRLTVNDGLFQGGMMFLGGNASAGNCEIVNEGAAQANFIGGLTLFTGNSSAASASITNGSASVSGGRTQFEGFSSAAQALITSEGDITGGFARGIVAFFDSAQAQNATLVATGGSNGGSGGLIEINDLSDGGTAQIQLLGNSSLSISGHHSGEAVTIGSLSGEGFALLGARDLIIGSNNLSTIFSGTMQDTGSITKVGTGTFTLSGANTYSGGTTISSGILLVSNISGSGTGSGAVSVNAGSLGGSGTIAGIVTIGTNTGVQAFLAPSKGAKKPATLAIQSALTLNDDATYLYKLDTKRGVSDQVLAQAVTIDDGAKFSLRASGTTQLPLGQVFTVISNTAASPISGHFHNLADGAIVNVNGNNLQASYTGGDGNDLTLTVVP